MRVLNQCGHLQVFHLFYLFTENLKQKEVEAWVLDFGEDWARGAGVNINFMLQFYLFC